MSKKKVSYIGWGLMVIILFAAPFLFEKEASFMFLDSINGVSPGTNGHILGTDTLGRDVLRGLLSGAKISLTLSVLSVGIALLIAVLLNIVTSYVGNNSIYLNVVQIIVTLLLIPLIYYYSFLAFPLHWSLKAGLLLLLTAVTISTLYALRGVSQIKFAIPLDTIGQKFYEFFSSIPKLILLLILVGLSPKNSMVGLALIIGLLLWPIFFRYIRIEILSEKGNDRFNSLKNLGYSDFRIVFRHFLPLMLPILSTPILFAIVSTILLEANLSFLGIGLGDDYVTWGTLLAEARRNTTAWWLIVFPGACLFMVFMILNSWLRRSDELR